MLAEIETDKATMEWEATDDGVLKKIYVEEGGKVNVGDRIAFIGDGEEAPAESGKDEEVGGEGGEIEESGSRRAGECACEKEGEACRGGRVDRTSW